MKKDIKVDTYVKGDGKAVSGHGKTVTTKDVNVDASFSAKASGVGLFQLVDSEISGGQVVAPGTIVEGKTFDGVSFSGMSVKGATFKDCVFKSCDLSGGDWSDVTLASVKFVESDVSSVNMSGVKATNVDVVGGSFNDSLIAGSSWDSTSFKYTKMRGLNMEDAVLRKVVLEGVDIRSANWTRTDFNVKELIGSAIPSDYDQYDFYEAVEEMGITEKQFEYFALSGALEIRDDISQEKILRDFDPDSQHIPAWQVHNPQWLQDK